MARSAMAWSRVCRAVWALVMLAVGFQPVAGYRLAIVSQPLCGSVAGLRLQRQPSVQVQITDASELVDSQRSWQPGEEVASGLQDEFRGGQVIDVLAQGSVSVAFGVNPVGATFENGANTTTMMMREGVADGRDVTVMGGGTGFTLVFTFTARDGSLLTVESEPFMCLGQSVSLKITRQPRLQLPGAVGEGISIQPEVTVVDSYGQVVPGAGPAVTVSIATNPSGSELSADSMATVRAEHGVAVFEELQLTRAASQVEAQVPAYEDQTTLFALRFSSPGFEDVISEPFEVLPLMAIDVQPYSDKKRVIHAACSGPVRPSPLNVCDNSVWPFATLRYPLDWRRRWGRQRGALTVDAWTRRKDASQHCGILLAWRQTATLPTGRGSRRSSRHCLTSASVARIWTAPGRWWSCFKWAGGLCRLKTICRALGKAVRLRDADWSAARTSAR
jgi:hypothetical protein